MAGLLMVYRGWGTSRGQARAFSIFERVCAVFLSHPPPLVFGLGKNIKRKSLCFHGKGNIAHFQSTAVLHKGKLFVIIAFFGMESEAPSPQATRREATLLQLQLALARSLRVLKLKSELLRAPLKSLKVLITLKMESKITFLLLRWTLVFQKCEEVLRLSCPLPLRVLLAVLLSVSF